MINDNIRSLRKQHHWTQDQFAQQLNIKRSLVGAYEEGRAEPRLELLQRMADVFKISVDQLIGGQVPGASEGTSYTRGKDIRIITIDSEQKDNIELVPHKAAAGYLNGYADAEFVKELPKFKLPVLSTGSYRAFEISGDSMLPILPGTIVIGEYVEDLRDLKNGKTYVLVTNRKELCTNASSIISPKTESFFWFQITVNMHPISWMQRMLWKPGRRKPISAFSFPMWKVRMTCQ